MRDPAISRLYIKDKKTSRWHEVAFSGEIGVTTFCGRTLYRERLVGRTTWPPHRAPRCKTCVTKALKERIS